MVHDCLTASLGKSLHVLLIFWGYSSCVSKNMNVFFFFVFVLSVYGTMDL